MPMRWQCYDRSEVFQFRERRCNSECLSKLVTLILSYNKIQRSLITDGWLLQFPHGRHHADLNSSSLQLVGLSDFLPKTKSKTPVLTKYHPRVYSDLKMNSRAPRSSGRLSDLLNTCGILPSLIRGFARVHCQR